MDTLPPSTPQQQFCLRWHNHQTSLLSSLPLLLDQSHLTDVTLSAEGRTVRAHRVVLSACSSFFSELFRTLEPPFHPVVVLPGTSFAALVSLLTFMYSGEVNVFEEQISSLLTLAETLGIKGLADFNGNITKSSPKSETSSSTKEHDIQSPVSAKIASPFENFFNKSFQFYPHLMTQPLNFSQSRRNEDNSMRYQTQNRLNNEDDARKTHENKKSKLSEMRKIDKIAENLRCGTANKGGVNYLDHPKIVIPQSSPNSLILKPPPLPTLPHHFLSDDGCAIPKTPENIFLDSPTMQSAESPTVDTMLEKTIGATIPKTGNSKLYATCFICHKQLSNQYNLRVHLETHQNVRYACTVCTHVSRSKDALRKHVSYRHPGTQSPCDSETRRKRSKAIKQEIIEPSTSLQQIIAQNQNPQVPEVGQKDVANSEPI